MFKRFVCRMTVLLLPVLAGGTANLVADCKDVHGKLSEKPVPPALCPSPVHVCTVAEISGQVKGDAGFVASAIIPSADTAVTGVVFIIGDVLVLNAQFENKRGTLHLKSAAAAPASPSGGGIVDNQTIVSGTGGFAGATGSIRLIGTVGPNGGSSSYEGTICLP